MGILAGSNTVHASFTSSGTFTPPAGTSPSNPLVCDVTVTGAGGGGAGWLSGYGGNGGNAGQSLSGQLIITGPTAVTVGTGGAGGAAGANGSAGTASSLGTISAVGGAGGSTSGTASTATARMDSSTAGGVGQNGAGRYVVVGPNSVGLFYQSLDAITWTPINVTGTGRANTVIYAGGQFVTVGWSQTTQTSTTGVTFIAGDATGGVAGAAMAYGNNTYVVIGRTDQTATTDATTSPNGTTWTTRTMSSSAKWISIAYGAGLFVAVSKDATNSYNTSPDGITWTTRTTLPTAPAAWMAITYAAGTFVAIGQNATNAAATSTDGITWTPRTMPANKAWTCVAYGNSTFVALCGLSQQSTAATSPDGITWTSRAMGINGDWSAITYSASTEQFIAVTNDGAANTMATSPDGITWTSRTAPIVQITGVAAGPTAPTGTGAAPVAASTIASPSGGTAGNHALAGDGGRGGGYTPPLGSSGLTSTAASVGQIPGAGGGGGGTGSRAGSAGANGVVTLTWSA